MHERSNWIWNNGHHLFIRDQMRFAGKLSKEWLIAQVQNPELVAWNLGA